MTGFGECLACGGPVERVGWDTVCLRCQDEDNEALHETNDLDDPDVYAVDLSGAEEGLPR